MGGTNLRRSTSEPHRRASSVRDGPRPWHVYGRGMPDSAPLGSASWVRQRRPLPTTEGFRGIHGVRLAGGAAPLVAMPPASTAVLARVSGVSEACFARSVKEVFGIPPHRYLLTRRIEQATALLRDPTWPSRTLPSRRAGTAWARSGARSATSPARARVSSGRARRPRRDQEISVLRAWGAQPSCLKRSAPRPRG